MTYKRTRANSADPLDDGVLRCRRCDSSVSSVTASDHGGMCNRCFVAYCNEPQHRPDVGSKLRDMRSWAYALRRRHEAGERLTQGQVACYRAALPEWRKEGEDE